MLSHLKVLLLFMSLVAFCSNPNWKSIKKSNSIMDTFIYSLFFLRCMMLLLYSRFSNRSTKNIFIRCLKIHPTWTTMCPIFSNIFLKLRTSIKNGTIQIFTWLNTNVTISFKVTAKVNIDLLIIKFIRSLHVMRIGYWNDESESRIFYLKKKIKFSCENFSPFRLSGFYLPPTI